jgi:DNA-binding winged helix-turn-helix (wHTH) protein
MNKPEHTRTIEQRPHQQQAVPCLVVLTGAQKGSAFWLERPGMRIGRAEDCGIVLNDASVSRHHAELVRGKDSWLLKDLDSKNGSFLGERPVQAESALRDGDVCRFGSVSLQFFMVLAIQSMDAASLHAGGLRLDAERMVAMLHDQEIALTEIEFRILAALIRRPGRILSVLALMRAAWPREQVVAESTVASHLRNLRKKLSRQNQGQDLIRSWYGRGYSLQSGAEQSA